MKWNQWLMLAIVSGAVFGLNACSLSRATPEDAVPYTPMLGRDRDNSARLLRQKQRRQRRSSRNQPQDAALRSKYQQVMNGMTYVQVVQILGAPTTNKVAHTWKTFNGELQIIFEDDRPQYVHPSKSVAPEKYREVQELVSQGASFNTLSAHLGSPDATSSRQVVWEFPGDGILLASFDDSDRLDSKRWRKRA